jgi:Abortive infection alpha
MTDDKKTTKLDVSSTAIEKGIDVAKDFAEKLVLPSIQELGLLVKDQISYWRFSNQVKILNKAKLICDKHNISIKAIPPKLLCPYLEYASLEEDPEIQESWATLLVNMVDSRQNIQNHVFPYILSQLSKDEFNILNNVFNEKMQRVSDLRRDLSTFLASRPQIEQDLQSQLPALQEKLKEFPPGNQYTYAIESYEIRSKIRGIGREINSLNFKEASIKRKISAPQIIPEQSVKEFEMANIIRLGLAKVVYEASAGTHSIEIPGGEPDSYRSIDFDIQVDTDTKTILTELGELFMDACRTKNSQPIQESFQ